MARVVTLALSRVMACGYVAEDSAVFYLLWSEWRASVVSLVGVPVWGHSRPIDGE